MRNTIIALLIAGVICFPIGILMAVLAFSGVAGAATNIAWMLFVLAFFGGGGLLVLALVLYLVSLRSRSSASAVR